jgi:hypothetical protein
MGKIAKRPKKSSQKKRPIRKYQDGGAVDDPKKKARKLMERSNKLKSMAAQQEQIGNAQIKNNAKGPMRNPYNPTEYLPVGKERLEIARKMREEAKRDSTESERVRKSVSKHRYGGTVKKKKR